MKKEAILVLVVMVLLMPFNSANALELYNWALNLNGSIYSAPGNYSPPDPGQLPTYIDDTAFDWSQGLGTISINYNTGIAGDYFVGSFFDHEIDQAINTYFNEYGAVYGSPSGNQSWEIDEPGWTIGNIYHNFENAALDNTNSITSVMPDDVSMALGWNFFLEDYQYAQINFYLSDIIPNSLFYLEHRDPDSNESLYFYSDLNIGGAATVPEPATITLLGLGLLGVAGLLKKNKA